MQKDREVGRGRPNLIPLINGFRGVKVTVQTYGDGFILGRRNGPYLPFKCSLWLPGERAHGRKGRYFLQEGIISRKAFQCWLRVLLERSKLSATLGATTATGGLWRGAGMCFWVLHAASHPNLSVSPAVSEPSATTGMLSYARRALHAPGLVMPTGRFCPAPQCTNKMASSCDPSRILMQEGIGLTALGK